MRDEPGDGDERAVLIGWLDFHRDALATKLDGVAPDDLIRSGLGGSTMSLLGLVRHLTEMERAYGVCGPLGRPMTYVYGPYEDGQPEGDFDGLTPAMVDDSLVAWRAERAAADEAIASVGLDHVAPGGRRSARWHVTKLLQEYARHNGHADLIRQSIDGATGE